MALHNFVAGESENVAENLDLNFQYLLGLIQQLQGETGVIASAFGTSTATAFSRYLLSGVGNAPGTSTAHGISGSLSNSETVGTAVGTSATNFFIRANASTVGTAVGTSNAEAFSQNSSVATATGSATVVGVGATRISRAGTATGTSTATGVGGSLRAATATATGKGTAVGVGQGSATEAQDGSFVASPGTSLFGSANPGTSGGALDSFALSAVPGSVIVNGTTDSSTAGAMELYYTNHTMYYWNSDDVWKQWNGSAGSWLTAADPRPQTVHESVEGYDLTTASDILYGSSTPGSAAAATATVGNGLDTWQLTGNPGQVKRNNVVDTSTANVVELYYHNHTVYQQAGGAFWHWDGTTWVSDTTSPVPTSPTINVAFIPNQYVGSAFEVSGTYQDYTTGSGTYATPGTGSITTPASVYQTGATGNVVWTIDTSNNILENGNAIPDGGNSAAIDYYQGSIYGQDMQTLSWYIWDPGSQTFSAASAPGNLPTAGGGSAIPTLQYQDAGGTWNNLPSTVNVKNDTFKFVHPAVNSVQSAYTVKVRDANNTGLIGASNSFQISSKGVLTLTGISIDNTSEIAGSAVGTVIGNVTVSTAGGSFTGTYSLSGTDAASFSMAGNKLENKVVLGAGTYHVTITATQTGAQGSPQTLPVTVTVSQESAQATSVTTAGPTIVGSSTPGTAGSQETWALTGTSGNLSVVLNGVTQTGTAGTTQLYYINHTLYRQTSQNAWLKFNGTVSGGQATFVSSSSPIPVIDDDGQNVASISMQAPSGTAPVTPLAGGPATLTLLSAGTALSGVTWSISGADAAKFQIINGNQLDTAGSLPAGTYHITINATLN